MTLIRYENKLPVLLRRFLGEDYESWSDQNFSSTPQVNIKESADDFVIEIAAPGFEKEDFEIQLDKNHLLVSAHKKENEPHMNKEEYYIRKEFNYQEFQHTFSLSEWVLKHKIDAAYNNGILQITIPKKEELKPKPVKNIRVN